MLKGIGLSRTVRLDWLDALAGMVLEGVEYKEIRGRLHQLLAEAQPGPVERDNVVDVLVRIWVRPDPGLQEQALLLYPRLSTREDRLWLHYGMVLAQYPFFRTCAAAIGQIGRLEEVIDKGEVRARMLDRYGNLGGSPRAISRLLVTLLDWGVLDKDDQGDMIRIVRHQYLASFPAMEEWLLYCALRGIPGGSVPFNDLINLPELYPFQFSLTTASLAATSMFDLQRQGSDLIMVHVAGNRSG